MTKVGPEITFAWEMGHEVFWRRVPDNVRGPIVAYRVSIKGERHYAVRFLDPCGNLQFEWFEESELDADDT